MKYLVLFIVIKKNDAMFTLYVLSICFQKLKQLQEERYLKSNVFLQHYSGYFLTKRRNDTSKSNSNCVLSQQKPFSIQNILHI